MGNCVWRALPGTAGGQGHGQAIRVVTSTGGIMEFHSSVTAERITNEFPGHGIFQGHPSPGPLLHNETLVGGHLYYLLPLDHRTKDEAAASADTAPPTVYGAAPYRMSFDSNVLFGRWRRAGAEAFPLCQNASSGVWKVKLVISPDQLAEILAEQSHTEALIDSVRTVAKCSGGYPPPASSSDEWSLSSGRRTSERER
ncbi:hypothetical protein EJ110_NYTH18417 [Nymphaea thermarum]|nr:hypothetical protein EJ110_NYTH18417 [Nymphaea thermarum]